MEAEEIPTISWGLRKLDLEESNDIERKYNSEIVQSKSVHS